MNSLRSGSILKALFVLVEGVSRTIDANYARWSSIVGLDDRVRLPRQV